MEKVSLKKWKNGFLDFLLFILFAWNMKICLEAKFKLQYLFLTYINFLVFKNFISSNLSEVLALVWLSHLPQIYLSYYFQISVLSIFRRLIYFLLIFELAFHGVFAIREQLHHIMPWNFFIHFCAVDVLISFILRFVTFLRCLKISTLVDTSW